MIIWPASTHQANWTTYLTPRWHYTHSEISYKNSKINLEWMKQMFGPQTKALANQNPRVLICNSFGTHETLEILEYCFENNIILCRLPSHTSHKLQPCDIGIFGSLRAAYRDKIKQLYRGGVDTVREKHFTSLYSLARNKTLTARNIKAAWAASGLFPFNPNRVLKNLSKPISLTSPKASEIEMDPSLQGEVLQAPMMSVTPVTSNALMLLHNLVVQHTHALDETSKQRLQRCIQKLANAAHISFAEGALLRDRAHFLSKMNNEAKVRRSTKSVIVGKAKVMSYEDIKEARAKRAAKGEATAANKKHGRARKDIAPEPKAQVTQMSEAPVLLKVLEVPCRAPVARMK